MVAACGVPVPMVSGRGLGHTGGTLDKLESIPGFQVGLTDEQFAQQVKDMGVSLIGQTATLAPADRKLYSLRDVTATVESIPLITASILSKKLAEGIDALVLDVKVGAGAFMKTHTSAKKLAESLVRVGGGAGVKVRALLTRMEQPLGLTIGNALEIKESIDILRGQGPEDSTELTYALGAEMLQLGGVADSPEQARVMLQKSVSDGSALGKFVEIIERQGGDARVVDDPSLLPEAPHRQEVRASESGYITAIDSYVLGMQAMILGAGRAAAEDPVDHAVGIELKCKVGTKIEKGEPLAVLHYRDMDKTVPSTAAKAFTLGQGQPTREPLILETLSS
jgi:pyrimidine-nucleoside phosphorylase